MEKFNDDIFPWLGVTSKMIDSYHTHLLKVEGFDLTKEQWVMLKVLSEHNGVSQNGIACLANRDKTSLARLFNTLEKKNLIARIPSNDDKRINLIYLTTRGERILSETEHIREDMVSDLQKNISDNEIDTVIQVLKKIHQNINDSKGC